jgi:ketosteroid isomerase-like protein
MRTKIVAIAVMVAAAGCASTSAMVEQPDVVRSRLMERDREFAEYTAAHGIALGFRAFVADDVVSLGNGEDPVLGRNALFESLSKTPEGVTLRWQPRGADAAASGELGYTWGTFVIRAPDKEGKVQERYGKYCTIWKKQADGAWKAVLDMGNSSPAPAENN